MIGEKLEEARKRKGVSIREAAEATKIRGDFLLEMEDNSFDIDLPQIYIRGFLKNYARYLHLDVQKILTDYDAQQMGRKSYTAARQQKRESYGEMEITDQGEETDNHNQSLFDDSTNKQESVSDIQSPATAVSPPPPTLEREPSTRDEEAWNESKALYMKIALGFVSLIVVGTFVLILIRLISNGDDAPEINPEIASTPSLSAAVSTPEPNNAGPSQTLNANPISSQVVITASDNVTIIVEQVTDRQRLYSGSLNAGQTISVEREGPVSIRFTNGTAISIVANGKSLTPQQSGVGRTVIE